MAIYPKAETWKPITGYENYEVSDIGNVKSTNFNRTGKARLLKPYINAYGYKEVQLSKNGDVKHFTVHRLVAMMFLPNEKRHAEVNHIDEDKMNNCVSNLEWCGHKHNINHGTRTQRAIDGESVRVYCVETNTFYKSASEAGKILGIKRTAINNCLRGRCNTSGGFHWRYASEVTP